MTFAGVFAYDSYGLITNCHTEFLSPSYYSGCLGGIVCENSGTIDNCTAAGEFNFVMMGGGISCRNMSVIKNCTNRCNVYLPSAAPGDCIGGIVAYQYEGRIVDCVNEGIIRDQSVTQIFTSYAVGGIVGRQLDTSEILNCTNNGRVRGSHTLYVGGIVGDGISTVASVTSVTRTISNCTNNGEISGYGKGIGNICGGLGGTNSIMTDCNYGGTVDGEPGTEANAIGYDARNE